MESNTKEKILDEALVCFAENGYEGTLLRNIASGLGLSKSALYKHYESKKAIWDALIEKMESYYDESINSADHLPEMPESLEEFLSLTMRMVNFTIHDEKIILMRKLLLTEQYHDDGLKTLATEYFLNRVKNTYRAILSEMMKKGLIKNDDPDMLAFVFTSPITSLIHYCDREHEKEPEIMRQIKAYMKHFISIYGIAR